MKPKSRDKEEIKSEKKKYFQPDNVKSYSRRPFDLPVTSDPRVLDGVWQQAGDDDLKVSDADLL